MDLETLMASVKTIDLPHDNNHTTLIHMMELLRSPMTVNKDYDVNDTEL